MLVATARMSPAVLAEAVVVVVLPVIHLWAATQQLVVQVSLNTSRSRQALSLVVAVRRVLERVEVLVRLVAETVVLLLAPSAAMQLPTQALVVVAQAKVGSTAVRAAPVSPMFVISPQAIHSRSQHLVAHQVRPATTPCGHLL
jgi:hypothetical protein